MSFARTFAAIALIAAVGIAPRLSEDPGSDWILGKRPHYGPARVSDVRNAAAIDARIWAPGLMDGWTPQGLAFADGRLFVSAYRRAHMFASRGPCRVFEIDPVTGRETGRFDVPPPCGHAGGLAYVADGLLYVADTHTLFEFDLRRISDTPRKWRLGPGVIATAGAGMIWLGSYREDQPGRIFGFDLGLVHSLVVDTVLTRELAVRDLAIPTYAQGAAIDADGHLWLARSEIAWGSLDRFDPTSGKPEARYPMPGGIEGSAFAAPGRLWAVSEAGARNAPLRYPFYPLIFRLDLGRLAN